MPSLDRALRKIVPSTALLSRSKLAWPVLAAVDWAARPLLRLFTRRPVPPLRYMVRTGVGNSIFFPQHYYLTASYNIWMYFFARGFARLDSRIVDIGSGVGKSAVALRDFVYVTERFTGHYHGIDVDPAMVEWSREHFDPERFRFSLVDMASSVYRPNGSGGAKPRLDCADGSVDLVFSQSLFSHLLEDDIRHYLAESCRILRPGGRMLMTFFCLDDLEEQGLLGERWTFRHSRGAARVENDRFPESAVAYRRAFMLEEARRAGFSEARIILPWYQSTIECVR
jgi:SAM-dependent methyltransferase